MKHGTLDDKARAPPVETTGRGHAGTRVARASLVDLQFLGFLASPWFVIPWYAIGLAGVFWVLHDVAHVNTPLNTAVKWAWPVIILFFSVVGLAFYWATSRPPSIGRFGDDEAAKKRVFREYADSTFRKVTASVIHCVGGDGIGIMTAMVVSRVVDMSFWWEFWFEYLVGYMFGWFIFQYKAMRARGNSPLMALSMGGRAEFFSMMTVMAGMGAVMAFVTPLVVGEQPEPSTFAFWGFGALGLFLGYLATYPMNWWLVKIEWKHGMG